MNLHQVVSGIVSTVNPNQPAVLQQSTGYTTNLDGTPTPNYAVIGGAIIQGNIAGNVLNVTAVAQGLVAMGQTVLGTGVSLGTVVTSQVSGTIGGVGSYNLNRSQNVIQGNLNTTGIIAQVQELSVHDLRQLDGLNIQGSMRAIYFSGDVEAIRRVNQRGGDLVTTFDNNIWLTTQILERYDDPGNTSGWCKVSVVLQNGS